MHIDLNHDEINRLISALNSDRWVVTNDLIYRDYTDEMIQKNEAIVLITELSSKLEKLSSEPDNDDIQVKLFEKFFLELDTYSCEECTACGKFTLEDHCPEVCLANKIARFFVASGARLPLDYLHNIERIEGVKNVLVED